MAGMSQDELKALVQSEMRQSLGYSSSKLSAARQKAEIYYLGLATGDLSPPEIDGRSSVVSTDVRDTVEAMLPQLMVTFTGGDKIAEFEPQNPDDEQKAKLATDYVNYLFFKKNNGHKVSYTWMKDALIQKNGIVKIWWDTRSEEKKESYRGMSEVELAQLLEDDEIEVIDQTSYPDDYDQDQREQAIKQLQAQAQQAQASGAPPQVLMQFQTQIEAILNAAPVLCYDVTCKRVAGEGKITIENVPPEEFLISRNARDIQTAKFVGHRVQRTISELKSMGYKNVDKISGEDQSQAVNIERITRLNWNDENAYLSDEITSGDESQRRVWVTESYVRCDFDGDGISELRKVTVAGNEMLDNEEVDFTPFVSITPVPLPHTFFGLSVADLAMESQRTKTSILRSQLDNMYLSVNGRYFAVTGQVNLDDLLTSRPGGVVRMNAPGMAGRLDQGNGNLGEAQAIMEYMQQDLENKTGWTRYSQGNDAKGLNQTATGINVITNKADMRIDLIARQFAEGYTELFKYILKLICQHQDKEAMVRLSGGWASIDPREWRNQFDVSINVGIGMGNKDQKVQHLMALIQQQQMTFPLGVTTPRNVYEASSELTKLLGFKGDERFFTDPIKNPPPPAPNPEQAKAQAQMQIEQAKLQGSAQMKAMELQHQAQLDQLKRDHEMALEQLKMNMQAQVDNNRQQAEAAQKTLEIQQQAQLEQLKAEQASRHKEADLALEKYKADLAAQTQMAVADMKRMPADNSSVENTVKQLFDHFSQPAVIIRDANGRAVGVQRGQPKE